MLALVIGGAASGKSAIAERLAASFADGPLYYIATMHVHDNEDIARVNKHRSMRDGKGFITLEQPRNLSLITVPQHSTLLVECLSNLVANEMYDEPQSIYDVSSIILNEVKELSQHAENLIVVSNDVFSDGIIYDPFCVEYINTLGSINKALAKIADVVIESVVGIPLLKKGEVVCLF